MGETLEGFNGIYDCNHPPLLPKNVANASRLFPLYLTKCSVSAETTMDN